ncbi:MAG: hypothetical protein EZS28_031691 [Streblomastix strix]|uniref:Uncharacterized protein n=1 Tax=Streblomastix strix TaxID=222440 RepID=A0A5J4URW1_9EUKA|nr:MAG: hypothetical protein EZS28_031691 [Streblomastix strix]
MILQLDRKNKPFGYRIANLLECNIIEDNEAKIARSVINTILHISNTSQNTLDENKIDTPILLSIKEYVERLLEIEKVPLEATPLIDLQTALACMVLKKLKEGKKKEQIELEEKNNRNRNLLIIALQDLLIDVYIWFLKHLKNQSSNYSIQQNPLQKMDNEEFKKIQWIRDAGQKLIEKAQNSYEDTLEVAKMIKLERSRWFQNAFHRLRCLCDDDRLDGYFSEYECPAYNNLKDKCKQFIVSFSKSSDDIYTQTYNEFKRQFPDIKNLSRQKGKKLFFREEMNIGVKIAPSQIRNIISAIKQFIPLFAPIDFIRTRNLRIDPTIFVRNQDQSIIGKDFNALIGGTGKDQLRFISSSITADFGIHIDRAQTSNCGNLQIDNLSNEDVTVELKDVEENKMKIKLVSNSVNFGEKIDIQFNIVEQHSEEPSVASIIFKIVAKSKKKSNQIAIYEIRAFVRRTPLCVLIESSSSLMLSSATSCTLAPKKFTEQINIKHHIPSVILSQKAIKWSLTSNDTNVADEPKIQLDNEKLQMMMQFESSTTGLCVGQMAIGFGLTDLYKLLLNVPVKASISTIQNIKNDQIIHSDVEGREINRVGVICGRFTEAENVVQLLEQIKSLKPPEFPPPTKIQENINTNLIKDLLGQVELKLEELINKFKIIKNPSELNQLLIQFPSLSSPIIIAIQCAENQNIYKLISSLCVLTIIVQELQNSKENNQILESQISQTVETCNQIWTQLIKAGITPPNEINLSKEILDKYNSNLLTSNIQIESIPECQMQRGVWRKQGSSDK